MGHSQGGIVLQGALAGLTNECKPARASCFDAQVARDRQSQIASAGIFGANVAMSSDNPSFRLKLMAGADIFFGSLGSKVIDRVPVGALARTNALLMTPVKVLARPLIGDASPNNALFWSFLWRRENVDRKARGLFARQVVEEVPVEVLRQYAEGVRKAGGIRTSSGETYVSALKNIVDVPVVMGTFRGDPLSPPEETKRDNFDMIGVPPSRKHFVSYAGLGHEDIFLNPLLHGNADSSIREMVDRGGGCAPAALK
jgi:hypothetical protein